VSYAAVADLIERYLNDGAFRSAFAQDPDAAVAAAGIELSAEEIAALHATVRSHDEPLRDRVSKYSFGS